ncbi:pirin family protein [Candidatus Nitrotoga arctica]|nr:pirin family protein [Candidatus Nitrotoga arctica]
MGGEHPHAGLETVTFMLSGTMEDLGGKLLEGDVEWMTAGRGIIHAEKAVVSEGMRLLQLWVVLPENQRHIAPRVQLLARDRMPVRQEPGSEARLYSGRSGGLEAATINAIPVTSIDIRNVQAPNEQDFADVGRLLTQSTTPNHPIFRRLYENRFATSVVFPASNRECDHGSHAGRRAGAATRGSRGSTRQIDSGRDDRRALPVL